MELPQTAVSSALRSWAKSISRFAVLGFRKSLFFYEHVRANFAFLACPRLAIEPHSVCWGTELGIGSFPFEHNATFAATPCTGFQSDLDSVTAFRRTPFAGLVLSRPTNRAEQPAALVASFCEPDAAVTQQPLALLPAELHCAPA